MIQVEENYNIGIPRGILIERIFGCVGGTT